MVPVPIPDFPGGRTGWRRLLRGVLPAVVAVATFAALTTLRGQPTDAPEPPAVGLPGGAHLHSFLVDADDSARVFLGTHFGVYVSGDGGASWEVAGLGGEDVLDLAHGSGGRLWAVGPRLIATSRDGGTSWRKVGARGLPRPDVQAVAADSRGDRVYVALAREGLFVSRDGGRTFDLHSTRVGRNVEALALLPGGRLLAADATLGLRLERVGNGDAWETLLRTRVRGLAAAPGGYPVLATTGEGLVLLAGAGAAPRAVLEIREGAGPVARAPSDPTVAYTVGLDRRVYRSRDGGETWAAVE